MERGADDAEDAGACERGGPGGGGGAAPGTPEHVDTLIVGAGISGIGAGYYLQRERPAATYAILEGRAGSGGTWDLFRYPGVRSDSDLHTLGYAFKPWTDDKAIAGGGAILRYIRETADEFGIAQHIRYGHRVVRAEWSSQEGRWTVQVAREDTGAADPAPTDPAHGAPVGAATGTTATVPAPRAAATDPAPRADSSDGVDSGQLLRMTCRFLFMATGYYRYDQGYTPDFLGSERFSGRIVHPQHWPDDLDYTGRRVVVIGSGATGMTLVPAMAERAAHVTMLQRSPSYVVPIASRDALANGLRRLLGDKRAYALVRRKNIAAQRLGYRISRRYPRPVKRVVRALQRRLLPPGYDIGTHFAPSYEPWDQRLCVVPDGDLFKAIADGKASIITDRVRTFTETGIELVSGEELAADVIVTATGLNLLALGGIPLVVDGKEIVLPQTVVHKGVMLAGVPNLAYAVGYVNASWTLKVDLVCQYLCRLLAHMDARGATVCVPAQPPGEPGERVPGEPGESVEPQGPARAAESVANSPGTQGSSIGPQVGNRRYLMDFAAGYIQRSIDSFPRQGPRAPWTVSMDYRQDVRLLRHAPVDDGTVWFGNPPGHKAT
jgi:cation diffusion facilitator CzcD-associated flavoprotein CzcO